MSTWIFEPGHTAAEFRARHMMVTWVRGAFKDINGRLELDWDRCLDATFEGKIDATAIWTGEPDRDAHLRSTDFLDVENHPEIIFSGRFTERTAETASQFAWLLDTAIANADSRDQLTASRARLLTAGDEARRRVVRDLHDGAQQRLVHTIVTLKLAQQAFRDEDEEPSRCSATRSNTRSRPTASCASSRTGSCPQCSPMAACGPASTRW